MSISSSPVNNVLSHVLFCSKLAIYLPYPVKHKSGKAQWVSDKLQLRVALPCIKPDPLTGELPILDD